MKSPVSATKFVTRLRLITAAMTAPTLVVAAHFAGILAAAAVLALVVVPLGWRVRLGFQDSKRSRLSIALAILFDVYWTGILFGPLLLVPALLWLLRSFDLVRVCEIAVGLAFVVSTYGVLVRRRWTRVRRVEIAIVGLPRPFDGYRIVQLSDLHIGSMNRAPSAMGWVRTANALAPDLVAVTGDVLSSGTAFHDETIATLGELRARDGVVGCLGNHDYYEEGSLCEALGARGVKMLRNEGRTITRENEHIFIAGVEDFWRGKPDLERACEDANGAKVVLLAHNPDYFPIARSAGVALTLSGHTHAGQLALPFMVAKVNLSRIAARWSWGVYRDGESVLFVHAGLGTTGPAIRIGAAPEIVEITLRAAG